jgi:hypothetical protein
VCPGGHFALEVDGVQLRDADGIHIVPTDAAGQWLDARVLPEVVRLGRLQMAHPGQGSSSSSGVG